MVWLYLPESEALTSELTSLFPHQEPCVSSRGKPMQPQSLERKWKKGGFIRLLSGLMLPASTGDLLLEKWITSLVGSHANLGVSQESKREQRMKDGFGGTLKKSFARFDLASYSWKTFQASLMGDLTPFLGTWPKSGSMLNGVCSKRLPLVQTITETDFSYLDIMPTPNASLMATEGSTRQLRDLYLKGKLTLEEATAINQGFNPLRKKGAMKQFFPTSEANPEKYSVQGNTQASKSLNAIHGGKLNPEWVEWLMGWPIGWTDLEPVVMELYHSKQPSHIPYLLKEQFKEVV